MQKTSGPSNTSGEVDRCVANKHCDHQWCKTLRSRAREQTCSCFTSESEARNSAPSNTLLAIGERLRTQDNRCTQNPMFCVQEKRREYGLDPRWTDNHVWVDTSGDDFDVSATAKEGYERTGYKDSWHTVMVAFTEAGCKEYLLQNGHNLHEPRIYVESFNRCPEMLAIREWLMLGARAEPCRGKSSCSRENQ